MQDYTNTRASTSSSSSTSGGQLNTEGIVAADTSAVLDHKVAKGDSKSKTKAKKADSLKDKERDRKEARRESKDERWLPCKWIHSAITVFPDYDSSSDWPHYFYIFRDTVASIEYFSYNTSHVCYT